MHAGTRAVASGFSALANNKAVCNFLSATWMCKLLLTHRPRLHSNVQSIGGRSAKISPRAQIEAVAVAVAAACDFPFRLLRSFYLRQLRQLKQVGWWNHLLLLLLLLPRRALLTGRQQWEWEGPERTGGNKQTAPSARPSLTLVLDW